MSHRTTRASLLATLCATAGVLAADSVFVPVNDVVIIEPERMQYSSTYWQRRTSPAGFRGDGWLYVAKGGTTGEDCHNVATLTSCLTPREGWIEIPVYLDEPQGDYGAIFGMDIRAYRDHDGDGGNDIWVGIDSVAAATTGYAWRIGCSTAGYNYCWGAITPTQLPGQGGWAYWSLRQTGKVYTFFVSPRSSTFGVDRITIYMVRKTNSKPGLVDLHWPDAWNNSAPMAPKVALDDVVGIPAGFVPSLRSQPLRASVGSGGELRVLGLRPDDRVTLLDFSGRRLAAPSLTAAAPALSRVRGSCIVSVRRDGALLGNVLVQGF